MQKAAEEYLEYDVDMFFEKIQNNFHERYEIDDNMVKITTSELDITQRELAERMDMPESTVARWKGGDLPRLAELYLNALLENIELKSKLETIKKAHEIVSNL